MAEDDRLIRELYAESAARPRADHPDEAAWEAMALGELPAADKQRILDHVTRCTECASVFRGLGMLAREAAGFDPAAPRKRDRRILAWPAPWVLAGLAAAAAVVLVTWLPGPRAGLPPAPVAAPSEDAVRSGEQAAPIPLEPKGTLTATPRAFRWEGVEGTRQYRVELSSRDGDLLWASPPVAGVTIDWPASVVPAPGLYHWQVIAMPDVDRPLASRVSSPVVSFEIAAR